MKGGGPVRGLQHLVTEFAQPPGRDRAGLARLGLLLRRSGSDAFGDRRQRMLRQKNAHGRAPAGTALEPDDTTGLARVGWARLRPQAPEARASGSAAASSRRLASATGDRIPAAASVIARVAQAPASPSWAKARTGSQ